MRDFKFLFFYSARSGNFSFNTYLFTSSTRFRYWELASWYTFFGAFQHYSCRSLKTLYNGYLKSNKSGKNKDNV